MKVIAVIALGVLLGACGGTDIQRWASPEANGDAATGGARECPAGTETCHCYGNSTCNAGLVCASNLCVALGSGGAGGAGAMADGGHGGRIVESDGGSVLDGGPPPDGGPALDGALPPHDAATAVDASPDRGPPGAVPDGGAGCLAQISAGADQTCARKKDGTLWCWGSSNLGELGNGDATGYSLSPVEVTALGHDVADVVAGEGRTCARKTDGTLWCWGMNFMGAVGDGSKGGVTCGGGLVCRTTPQHVAGSIGTSADQFSVGGWSTCACSPDSSLWCWGLANWGQLGGTLSGEMCGSNTCATSPIEVTALGKTVAEVAAAETYACARLKDGTVWCWGHLLNNGSPGGSAAPVQITPVAHFTQLAGTFDYDCAVDDQGSAWCWGWGETPKRIAALGTDVVEVGAGASGACARTKDGSVWCWGSNAFGKLGDGTMDFSDVPVRVRKLRGKVVQLSVGGGDRGHNCALLEDGTGWCWGRNDFGQLGDGTNEQRLEPVRVTVCDPDAG
jgi:alpha-tubulin suppressor-like RCC1 family protein